MRFHLVHFPQSIMAPKHRLPTQAEPMTRSIAVVVPDIEIIRILADRARHADDLLAVLATAKTGGTGITDLHAEVGLSAAAILIAIADTPAFGTLVVAFIPGSIRACLRAGWPRKTRPIHCRYKSMHRGMARWHTPPGRV